MVLITYGFSFPQFTIILPLLHIGLSFPFKSAIALAKQRIIIFSIISFGASSDLGHDQLQNKEVSFIYLIFTD
jgi:hypothetical protein